MYYWYVGVVVFFLREKNKRVTVLVFVAGVLWLSATPLISLFVCMWVSITMDEATVQNNIFLCNLYYPFVIKKKYNLLANKQSQLNCKSLCPVEFFFYFLNDLFCQLTFKLTSTWRAVSFKDIDRPIMSHVPWKTHKESSG